MMGNIAGKISIENVLRGCGVGFVKKANPLDFEQAIAVVTEATEYKGVSVVIFEAPCIAIIKPNKIQRVKENCIGCKKCIKEIGCPAMSSKENKVEIHPDLCYGCQLCTNTCPVKAVGGAEE